eukprot:6732660-Prymnesium_polylepis.1
MLAVTLGLHLALHRLSPVPHSRRAPPPALVAAGADDYDEFGRFNPRYGPPGAAEQPTTNEQPGGPEIEWLTIGGCDVLMPRVEATGIIHFVGGAL